MREAQSNRHFHFFYIHFYVCMCPFEKRRRTNRIFIICQVPLRFIVSNVQGKKVSGSFFLCLIGRVTRLENN